MSPCALSRDRCEAFSCALRRRHPPSREAARGTSAAPEESGSRSAIYAVRASASASQPHFNSGSESEAKAQKSSTSAGL